MSKRQNDYEPLDKQLDIIYDRYGKNAFKTKEQLKIIMRQRGLHHVHGKNLLPSDLQIDYAWDYLEGEYGEKEIFEIEEIIPSRKVHVIRDSRTGRFVRWLS